VASDVEIDRPLERVAATLNDRRLPKFDSGGAQAIVGQALGGSPALTVVDGGGLHDETGARIGTIRRIGSGEWVAERQNRRIGSGESVAERQNEAAERSATAVPTQPPWGGLRKLLTKLHVRG
jgi:hypothetical protein